MQANDLPVISLSDGEAQLPPQPAVDPASRSRNSVLSWRGAIAMAVFAVALRVLVVAGAMLFHHHSLAEIFLFRDGGSYIAMAHALSGEHFPVTAYDQRVFLGFPAALALLHVVTRIPIDVLGLAVNWICAALVSIQATALFRDARVGWAMACLTPSYLMYSSLLMSESFFLTLALCAVWLAIRSTKATLAGIVFGAAASVRPIALFPALGSGLVLLLQGSWRKALIIGAVSAAIIGAIMLFNKAWVGDALVNLNRYQSVGGFQGSLFVAPFSAILSAPLSGRLPLWKSVYLLVHLSFALVACAFAVREALAQRRAAHEDEPQKRPAVLACAWLIGNTAFAVCIGSDAGVNEFHRYIIPALPPAFYALRKYLPTRPLAWSVVALCSVALAIAGARQ